MMKSINWKVFLLSLAAQFIISLLLNLGIKAPKALAVFDLSRFKPVGIVNTVKSNIASPNNVTPVNNFFDAIKTKLEPKKDDFNQASAYIAVDLDSGQVLAEKNAHEKLPIASLTKIMTAVIALDLADPAEEFTVLNDAVNVQPTTIGVVPGQKMTLVELLNAGLMTSANDAITVIKDGINQKYTQDILVQAMNAKAQILGLKNTHFENPQGFDSKGNFSTAEDLAILSHYALANYPLIEGIAKKDYQLLPADQNHKQFDLYNWNGLLGVYPGVYGLKIGNTNQAGYTTVVASERDNHRVLVVLLGAPGVLERDLWASELLDIGFEKLGLDPIGITETDLRAKYATWKYW